MASEIENARIESTTLGREDHGIFTAHLHLRGSCWAQSFGGLFLDGYSSAKKKRVGHAFGIAFIAAVLETLGVQCWESLPGTVCRVKVAEGRIAEIGHVIEDRWLDPKALYEEYREGEVVRW